MNIHAVSGAEHSEYIAALTAKPKRQERPGNTAGIPASWGMDTVNISPEARAARQAAEEKRQHPHNEAELPLTGEKLLFPTLHYDATEFMKENPDASERELWNYLDEKYNFRRSTGMMTLEEAQEKLQPYVPANPRDCKGWNPAAIWTDIGIEEWKRAFLQ